MNDLADDLDRAYAALTSVRTAERSGRLGEWQFAELGELLEEFATEIGGVLEPPAKVMRRATAAVLAEGDGDDETIQDVLDVGA